MYALLKEIFISKLPKNKITADPKRASFIYGIVK
jgi:hypothetical protein